MRLPFPVPLHTHNAFPLSSFPHLPPDSSAPYCTTCGRKLINDSDRVDVVVAGEGCTEAVGDVGRVGDFPPGERLVGVDVPFPFARVPLASGGRTSSAMHLKRRSMHLPLFIARSKTVGNREENNSHVYEIQQLALSDKTLFCVAQVRYRMRASLSICVYDN